MSTIDPLARNEGKSDTDNSPARGESNAHPTSAEYYHGFYAAEKLRPIVNHEPSLLGSILSTALFSMPVIVGAYIFFRFQTYGGLQGILKRMGQAQGHSPSGRPTQGGFLEDLMKPIDPLGGRKTFRVEVKDTKFKDVIGVPEALEEVRQYVDFLREPSRFTRLGGRIPKGCLLTGQPGTGKTLLAKAIAGEANVPFFTCSGSDFVEIYVGSGPRRVRELFEDAKRDAPSVVFVDEIDAIGSRNPGGFGGFGGSIATEENRTINQLLAELDGLQQGEPVVVFAATNFADNLDKAILREGRFDRKVEIPMPDQTARTDLFTHYLNKIVTGDKHGLTAVDVLNFNKQPGNSNSSSSAAPGTKIPVPPEVLDDRIHNREIASELSRLTPGSSPATIAAIVNEGALASAINGEPRVTIDSLRSAIDDVLIGKKHRSRMTDSVAQRVALHEAGHCLVAWMLAQQTDVVKLSITPRGAAAGFTQQLGREIQEYHTDVTMFTDICVMLGGRVAELTQHTNTTTGAQDDFQRATKHALSAFLAFGMSKRLGLLSFDYQRLDQGRMYQLCSEKTQFIAESEATQLVQAAYHFTEELVNGHKEKLARLATELFLKKELTTGDIVPLLGPRPQPHPTSKTTRLKPIPLPREAQMALERFCNVADTVAVSNSEENENPALCVDQPVLSAP